MKRRTRNLVVPDIVFIEEDAVVEGYDVDPLHSGEPPDPGSDEELDPNVDYVGCVYPSTQPSTSPSPTTSHAPSTSVSPSSRPSTSVVPSTSPSALPSLSPSTSPSNQPSDLPSLGPSSSPSAIPSLSHSPSVSHQPSFSAAPSGSPSVAKAFACDGADAAVAPGVRAVDSNATEPSWDLVYSMVTMDNADPNAVAELVDNFILEQVLGLVLDCPDPAPDHDHAPHRRLQEGSCGLDPDVIIDGISLNELDYVVSTKECSSAMVESLISGSKCQVYAGDFTVYVRDSSGVTDDQAKEKVLKAIKKILDGDECNGDATTRFIDDNDEIVAIKFDIGQDANDELAGFAGAESVPVGVAVVGGVSAMGGVLIATGSIITLLFVFAASRKRKHHRLQRVEQVIEDDESIFGKSFDHGTDIASNGSNAWRQERGAHILGEDDSVNSVDFDGDDIMGDLKMAESRRLYGMGSRGNPLGPQENDLGRRGDSLNVHSCTSATCPICTRSDQPTFINSDLLSPIEEDSREEATTPCYSDTVDMDVTERLYKSPDTVQL